MWGQDLVFVMAQISFPSIVYTYPHVLIKVVDPQKLDLRQKYIILLSRITILLLKGYFEREKTILHEKNLKHRIVYCITRDETQRLQTSVKFITRAKRGLQSRTS